MIENVILSSSNSFQITIDGITDENEFFYSIEGLTIGYQTQTYIPGGEANNVTLTSQVVTQPLVIKRPLSNNKSGFSEWCIKTLETGIFEPVTMNIFIFNNDSSINNHWIVEQAYPVSMKITPIDIENETKVISEIITVMYVNLKRVK